MSDLLIRDLDDVLRARLEARAQAHRRSLEDEAREMLRAAVASDAVEPEQQEHPVDVFLRLFGPEHGIDLDLPPRSADVDRPPLDFSGPEYDR